ncbi:YadA C-terminal domain-containing protein (plasmid) [Edwardsiella tarda]|uniref:YadA C-terminal domain-containing protein n=1 Tax=Edwardsiella tarda TaxID=636 RepID=UPI0024438801|nr:YadA C-terminal domain-containing protein [Edwardsiella tarda]WGE31052.1 YadA C-terminal domain-containing protein [Edwardsiella tarda]
MQSTNKMFLSLVLAAAAAVPAAAAAAVPAAAAAAVPVSQDAQNLLGNINSTQYMTSDLAKSLMDFMKSYSGTSNTATAAKLVDQNLANEEEYASYIESKKAEEKASDLDTLRQAVIANGQAISSPDLKNYWRTLVDNRVHDMQSQINQNKKEIGQVAAKSAALSGLFQPYNVGRFNTTVALGGYKSETAMAVGVGYRFNDQTAAKAGLAFGSNSVAYNVGLDYEW